QASHGGEEVTTPANFEDAATERRRLTTQLYEIEGKLARLAPYGHVSSRSRHQLKVQLENVREQLRAVKIWMAENPPPKQEPRGLRVRVDPGPPAQPVLVKPGKVSDEMVTPELMGALKTWRLEIIEEVGHTGSN